MNGHQVYEDWLGERVLTLADLLPAQPLAVCVGINPSPVSVNVGHYYQGALGQRFLSRLRRAGLIDCAENGFEDDQAVRSGIGFTDIVKRPTARADEVAADELAAGARLLEARLAPVSPRLLVFTFKRTAQVLFGKFPGVGFLDELSFAGSPCYVMPSPYARVSEVDEHLRVLSEWVRSHRSP